MTSHLGWKGIGTGIVYNGGLAQDLLSTPSMVDAISVVPETLWHESSGPRQYRWIAGAVEQFDLSCSRAPLVFHGIGLSLGSGLPLDVEHLGQVAMAAERYKPLWYSEHLAAFRVGRGSGGQARAGIGLPVPLDRATLHELVPKVAGVVSRLGLPVLLENSAIYVEVPGPEMSEAAFLNRLCDETGAYILLDLHNLMVNEVNLGWNAEEYLAELDLARVVEIHVAGGEMLGKWYTDAHSGTCPDRVWELLDSVVPVTPMLRLVTFEVHESHLERLGPVGLDAELSRIRSSIGSVTSDIS
jgi:uncharacterized protein (UPF0276 family)